MIRAALVLGALILVGCGGEPQQEGALAPGGPWSYTAADGATIPYEIAGTGETTVVLVHCWMCDRSFWEAQIPVLAERYQVISLDLPGHGEGSDDREEWTVLGFGADLAGLLEELELEQAILVGHSMGGPVSLRAAALAPGRVAGVVAVDTLHDAEMDMSGPMVEQMVEMFTNDFLAACAVMVDRMFPEEGVEAIRDEVLRKGCEEGNAEAGKALIVDFAGVDFRTLFSEAGVPIRAINAAAGNPTETQTNRKYADFDAVLMNGVGHYPHMTRPEQFNPLLLAAVEQLAGG